MHVIDLPEWAVRRGAGLNAFATVDPAATALVVIDMQNAFVAEDHVFGNPHARDIIGPVNLLASLFRDAGVPVIWTRQTHSFEPPLAPPPWQYDLNDPGVAQAVQALQAGAQGHVLHPAMAVASHDVVVDKYRYGALSCPAATLAHTLAELGCEMVVIAGTLTNVCCESTARELNMAGYKVVVVSDATAAVTDVEHNAALLNLRLNFADVLTVEELSSRLISSGEPA